MMNLIMLIGRMSGDIETIKINEKECNIFKLAVSRYFKNENGEYDIDEFPIVLWEGIANNVKEDCHNGDTMGVKGRLQTRDGNIEIIAEKVSFLQSKKSEE